MDTTNASTTSSSTPSSTPPSTPTGFPRAASPSPSSSTAEHGAANPGAANDGAKTDATAAPFVDTLLKRATQGAHDAVDGVAAKVASAVGGVQDGVSKVGDTRDEWVDAARDTIRQHPFAAVGGALLVGAALLSLLSSSRD